MGRPEQRQRDKRKAGETCQKIDEVFKRQKSTELVESESKDEGGQEIPDSETDISPTHKAQNADCSSKSTSLDNDNTSSPATTVHTPGEGSSTFKASSSSSTSSEAPQLPMTSDIGSLTNSEMSADDVAHVLDKLTTGEKYNLLVNHFIPDEGFQFPTTFINKYKRRCQHQWLKEFPWMVYSKSRDGVFCKYCSILVSQTKRKTCRGFVNQPQTNWNKTIVAAREHQKLEYHMDAVAAGKALIQTVENPKHAVDNIIDQKRLQNIAENRHILECMVEGILYCAKQCIGLRGDVEKVDSPGNPGNFIAFLKVEAEHDEILKTHLFTPRNPKAKYISAKTQNELIEIMGSQIKQEILDEVKEAKYFTILADEVTAHNKTYMPLVLRFVDANNNIREEFLKFSVLKRITGNAIAEQIISDLEGDFGLETTNLRGQGYDGAANMASAAKGVQGLIREKAPLALYQHCAGHCLNLVVVHSSKISDVRNVLDNLSQVCLFFKSSPKRMNTLIDVMEKELPDSKKRPLLNLCKTRWAERHDAYRHFFQNYRCIVIALERIGMNEHCGVYSEEFDDPWDRDNSCRAKGLLTAITNFVFIVTFMIIYKWLSHVEGITIKLQGSSMDIINAYNQVEEVAQVYADLSSNIDKEFQTLYLDAIDMAENVGVEPAKPRLCGRQLHRANADMGDDIEAYYRVNIAIPFIDHIRMHMMTKFDGMNRTAVKLLALVPAVIRNGDTDPKVRQDLQATIDLYKDDLPAPELIDPEFSRWKQRFKSQDNCPATLATAIKDCDKDMFPNISVLLKIGCTLPVTSCECERNASTLRRLNTFMRASMSEERLSSLALLHIHYDRKVDIDSVVETFARQHPRKLQLQSVLFQQQ